MKKSFRLLVLPLILLFVLAACQADDARRVDRQPQTVGAMWQAEQPQLRPLPAAYDCSSSHEVTLN